MTEWQNLKKRSKNLTVRTISVASCLVDALLAQPACSLVQLVQSPVKHMLSDATGPLHCIYITISNRYTMTTTEQYHILDQRTFFVQFETAS